MTFALAVLTFSTVVVGLSMLLNLASAKLQNYGTVAVDINDGEEQLSVEGGPNLLSILNANKIFIPSGCGGQATCGLCKLKILDGGGPVLPTETPFLSRQEIREDVRLSCQVKVKTDMTIRIPEDYLHVQEYRGVVEHVEQKTYDIFDVRVKLIEPDTISFRAGQYIQMKAPDPKGREDIYRAYSLASAEYDSGAIELVVRLIPGGICSTYLCETIKPGDEVIFNGPFGEFVLSDDPESELVCVGGGSGMAPMKSLIFSVLEKDPNRTCSFFFGCRGVADIFYLEMFQELEKKHPNFSCVYALSALEEGEEWDGPKGFVHLSVDKDLPDNPKRQAFLCGPPLMVDAVTQVLRSKGVKKRNIFFDDFGI